MTLPGGLHHVELWVPDLARARAEWGWLLGQLGYEPFQDWDDGCSWRLGGTYFVVEQSPALTASCHDRHPYAGGPEHYAAYLASTDGFEVELVAP
jgi:catechol 2,3-dioxygenase-like lactoylglutathione lyase family enzyme